MKEEFLFSSELQVSQPFLDAMTDCSWIADQYGCLLQVNPVCLDLLGYPREELIGINMTNLETKKTPEEVKGLFQEAAVLGRISYQAAYRCHNGSIFKASASISPLKTGRQTLFLVVASDQIKICEMESRYQTTISLLNLFPHSSNRKEYLDSVVELIRLWSGCRYLGIRILDPEGNIPYESYIGFSMEFWNLENWLCVKRDQCACIRCIGANPAPVDLPVMTPGGSFLAENILEFLATLDETNRSKFRGICVDYGFRSIAIVPIKYHGKLVGGIHLAEETPGGVNRKIVEFLESVAQSIGEAVLRFNLEESIKISQEHFDVLRKRGEEAHQRYYDTQNVINSLLGFSLQNNSLVDHLNHALGLILTIPWLSFEASGCILLTEEIPGVLVMKAQKGIDPSTLEQCAQVLFGNCLCGQAAALQETQFAAALDERHQISYQGIKPHGHYCVPIISDGQTLGVINIYLKEGHEHDAREEEFLKIIANTLAGVIMRKQAENKLKESEERYRSLIKQSSEGVFILDPQTKRVQEANNQFLMMLGYTEEEIKGLTLGEIITGERELGSTSNLIPDEGVLSGERRIRCKDSSFMDAEVNSSLIQYGNTSVILGNVRDVTKLKQANEIIRGNMEKLQKTLGGIVHALASTTERRDPYTAGHQRRVSELACAIAREAGFKEDTIDGIRVAGLLHDIGKIYVPAEILSKPGHLNELEMGIIRTHPQVGYDILKKIEFPWPVAQIVLQHQERIDGSGYPTGVTGENILPEARILAVADVVEAMASHRPYRPALGLKKALAEISENRSILYDSYFVEICLRLFTKKGFMLKFSD